eukprot:gnl/TRDRNA2_/TRDRNA2_80604_c0_seq1.p1 gnl/TRDRNA2_/TRDRNA2_80604_c0~~gnl/TRDRNA2_/TRDRNA2_80604_c0_seq1.p1  ORF type:complete len:237 (+),score=34.28 gnl/TRDRNA2_/TRDRNA2_80604_c0_seq1:87-713(+)
MYPADGAKLLTSSLMHCCSVRPYKAAGILIGCSGTCAVLLIAWGIYSFENGIRGGIAGGGQGFSGMSAFSGALPGLLGLMALQETWTIYNLRRENRLSQHSYFRAARTDITQSRDGARLNLTGLDNPNQAFGNTSGLEESPGCCLARWRCLCCPGWGSRRQAPTVAELPDSLVLQPADPEASRQTREDRTRFLENLESQHSRPAREMR